MREAIAVGLAGERGSRNVSRPQQDVSALHSDLKLVECYK